MGFEVISCPLTSVCLLVKLVECGEWCGVSSHFSISVICFLFYHLQNTSSSFQESKNTLKCVQFYPDENFNSIVSPEYFIMQWFWLCVLGTDRRCFSVSSVLGIFAEEKCILFGCDLLVCFFFFTILSRIYSVRFRLHRSQVTSLELHRYWPRSKWNSWADTALILKHWKAGLSNALNREPVYTYSVPYKEDRFVVQNIKMTTVEHVIVSGLLSQWLTFSIANISWMLDSFQKSKFPGFGDDL